jgi:hypothetical protein
MIPRIKIVCFFYNEETLAEFFIRHYRWADRIHAVLSRSTDGTRAVLSRAPNVVIEDFEFPGGRMDDFLKRDKVNSLLLEPSEFDWIIIVDADEFIWPSVRADELSARAAGLTVREHLASVPANDTVLRARMWNVFRHATEGDLDPNNEPVVLQRRHGDVDLNSTGNAQYQKPIVLRTNLGFQLVPGNHGLLPNPNTRLSFRTFDGAHWQNADPSFCITRRCRDRRDRQSAANLKFGLGSQHHHVTEAEALELCRAHLNDPQCF